MASYRNILLKNGRGIPGVHCVLYNLNNVKVAATTTEGVTNPDHNPNNHVTGRYTFTNVNPGQYEVRFFGEGFDSDDNLTINIAGDNINLDKELLLQSLVERFSSLVWASRSVIDVMADSTAAVRANTTELIIQNGALTLPKSTVAGNTYYYYTEDFETSISGNTISGVDITTCYADFIQGEGDIIIETQHDSSNYYTWLNTATSTNNLGNEIEDTSFTDGTKIRLRIGITPGPNNTGGQVNHIAFYTGPDLFD